jgi:hypothetical protein
MNEQLGGFLREQLYPDIKNWIASLARALTVPVKKAKSPRFSSPALLLDALKANQVAVDSWITLECKPSTFGPFLRSHILSPIVGSSTDMRLGPALLAENPLMGVMAQATSHLKPVGLYPLITETLSQLCLYPANTTACGFMGLFPGVNSLVEYVPAVTTPQKLSHCGSACNVQGIVRCATPAMLQDVGVPIETWEELRQAGTIWYLDLFSEGTTVTPEGEALVTELWGALYASGHIEFEGQLQLKPLIDGMAESIRVSGVEPHLTQNQAARKEILVYGRGIRAVIDTQAPIYSLHMDADIGLNYANARARFDSVCDSFQKAILDAASLSSVQVTNPNDLDFTYTNSSQAFSVLASASANAIADPVGMAVRDWHRKRSAKVSP